MDSQAAEPAKKKKKLKKVTSAPTLARSAEERLAAFGDAFLESIEGRPVTVQKQRRSQDTPSVANTEAKLGLGHDNNAIATAPGKRKKKNKKGRKPVDSGVDTTAATVDHIARARSLEMSDKPSSDKPALRLPQRISKAEQRRFMSGKVSDIRSKGIEPPKKRGGGGGADPEEDAEFRKTLREVLDYVTPQLGKQERRQYEQAKIRALGGQLDERPKRPLNLLKKDAKRFAAKREEILEEEKHLGVSMSASKHRGRYEVDKLLKEKKEMLRDKKRRREDGHNINALGLGAKEKFGMATISKGAARQYGGHG